MLVQSGHAHRLPHLAASDLLVAPIEAVLAAGPEC